MLTPFLAGSKEGVVPADEDDPQADDSGAFGGGRVEVEHMEVNPTHNTSEAEDGDDDEAEANAGNEGDDGDDDEAEANAGN